MKLHVKNFGPIREAEVELKPLTVFVGPSNTGKSYLAMLLYSTIKTLNDDRILRAIQRSCHASLPEVPLNEWLTTVSSPEIVPVVEGAISAFAEEVRRIWMEEAKRCFGAEWDIVANQNSKNSLAMSYDYGVLTLGMFDAQKDKLPDAQQFVNALILGIGEFVSKLDSTKIGLGVLCGGMIYGNLLFPRHIPDEVGISDIHYLPATRGGMMHSHRDLAGVILRGAAAPAPDTGRLNGTSADFLDKLLNIGDGEMRKNRSRENAADIGGLSRRIEDEILSGQIETQISETGYPFFRYRFGGKSKEQRDISLLNASTSVSELAPVILFMRYYLAKGSVFIVEEPESHLHPAAQRKLASVLAGLVKAGVYVVVTTHSDMFLEQLSNFVHAHGYPETNLLNEKSGERTISEDQTAVYSFADSHPDKGTAVRKIDFDEDTGMLPRDHLDESSDLYNETVDIFNTKKEQAANDN